VNQLSLKNLAYIRMLINFLALFGKNANAKFNKPTCNPERRSKRIKEPEGNNRNPTLNFTQGRCHQGFLYSFRWF